ncbi:MAG: antibiotic biosynthesis monooxygenase [Bacteroidota bacterium]
MFINTIEMPPIKPEKGKEFLEWFRWSNSIYKNFEGFISRRLLKQITGNRNYVILMEHESEETFMKMHSSKEQIEAFAKLNPLLDGKRIVNFYEVVVDNL